MESKYLNKMVGAKGYTKLKRRYDLPSGKVFYRGDMVNVDKWPELKEAINDEVIRKDGSTRQRKRTDKLDTDKQRI